MTCATSDDPNGRHRDPVTGTVMEPALLHFLDAVLNMTDPDGPQVGLVCLAIDGLPALTETHGEAVRDAMLLGLADLMHEQVRTQDMVGRVDDGFGVCLADVFPAQAIAAAERLRRVSAVRPVPTPVGAMSLTCSIGLVLSQGGGEQGAAMMARAREARDAARRAGDGSLVTVA
jgi:diguanylate cyclase (GGDEF)-like protein